MSGFAHAIAGGDGKLVVTVFQSPNYVPGVSGWAVFKNGDAEFNSGTFRGYIVGGSLFIYSGTPGLGNPPVFSITDASTDPYGNTVQPGFVVNDGTGYVQMDINSSVGAAALNMITGATSEAEHAALYSLIVNKGLANESLQTNLLGPGSSHDNAQMLLQLASAPADGSGLAVGVMYAGVSSSFTPIAFWSVNGFRSVDTWHAMSLATGFSAGGQTPEYRLGLDGRVWFRGSVNLTATHAANVAFWTPPTGYIPAVAQSFASPNSLSGYAAGGISVKLATTPAAAIGVNGVSGNFVTLDGISYTLDS